VFLITVSAASRNRSACASFALLLIMTTGRSDLSIGDLLRRDGKRKRARACDYRATVCRNRSSAYQSKCAPTVRTGCAAARADAQPLSPYSANP
jgi:hypothetical protein